MDLASLGQAGTWLEELRHHKGEGLISSDIEGSEGILNFCAACKYLEEKDRRLEEEEFLY